MRRLVQLLIPSLLLCGCFGPGEGVEVPQDQIYFPVGLTVDRSAKHLFVVSSDFDLQYNAGALQSYELVTLKRDLPKLCNDDSVCKSGVCDAGLCILPDSVGKADETPCLQG